MNTSAASRILSTRDWAPLLPLIILMVWLGSYTQSFMPSITAATSHLLDQTNMNNQYRVQVSPPGAAQLAMRRSTVFTGVSDAR